MMILKSEYNFSGVEIGGRGVITTVRAFENLAPDIGCIKIRLG